MPEQESDEEVSCIKGNCDGDFEFDGFSATCKKCGYSTDG